MTEKGQLTRQECRELEIVTRTPGYDVLMAIAAREVRNHEIDLVNTDPVKSQKVRELHRRARYAGEFLKTLREAIDYAVREGQPPEHEEQPLEYSGLEELQEELQGTYYAGLAEGGE